MEAARQDSTIAGTIGWPSSDDTNEAISVMDSTRVADSTRASSTQVVNGTQTALSLPLISPSASSDALTNRSIYFFRVVPPAQEQGEVAAQYAREGMKAKHIALFSKIGNSSSQDLANTFKRSFTLKNSFSATEETPHIVVDELYTDSKGLSTQVDEALKHDPDLIYFPGSAQDVGAILKELQKKDRTDLLVLGGDEYYQLDYNKQLDKDQLNLSPLRFTSFAYPDEWNILNKPSLSPFSSDYAGTFDPSTFDPSGSMKGRYGVGRPNSDAILSHDALATLLEAYTRAANSTSIKSDTIWQSLRNISDANPFLPQSPQPSGSNLSPASGRIAFKPYGNPSDKTLVFLCFNARQQIQLKWFSKSLLQDDSTPISDNPHWHEATC